MHAERTPNPNSIKWVLGQPVVSPTAGVSSASFDADVRPEESPLAAAIVAIDGIESVFLGPKFVTVTKTESAEWTELAAPIVAEIKGYSSQTIRATKVSLNFGSDMLYASWQHGMELLAKLRSLTNLRIVADPESPTGWTREYAPFPGWDHDPVW